MLCQLVLSLVLLSSMLQRGLLYRPTCHRSLAVRVHKCNAGKNAIPPSYKTKICTAIDEIGRQKWNSFVSDMDSPFIEYDWLHSLEASKCVSADNGWVPLHIAVYDSDSFDESSLVALSPMYVKYDSYGEFIFDQSWASYCEGVLRIPYYPKLLMAIPYTPATGTRIIFCQRLRDLPANENSEATSAIVTKIAQTVVQLVAQNKLSSGHVNFMKEEEVHTFLDTAFLHRQTIQYRWENNVNVNNRSALPPSFHVDFDSYLSNFKSKRRIQIKSERRKIVESGVNIKLIRGDADEAGEDFYLTMFELYQTTVQKMWGTQYLSKEFFQLISKAPREFKKHLLFIVATAPGSERVIAGTINFVKGEKFYGRYWGAFEFVDNLHFELCIVFTSYYKAIEYCIDNKIQYMEPGAGGGEFKYLRGFDPYIVNSVHYIENIKFRTAVRDFLEQERQHNTALSSFLVARSKKQVN